MQTLRYISSTVKEIALRLIFNTPGPLGNDLRLWYLGKRVKSLGKNVVIGTDCTFQGLANISLGDNFICLDHCTFSAVDGALTVGKHVGLNRNSTLDASTGGSIVIEDYVSLAQNVVLRAADHNYQGSSNLIREQGHNAGTIVVKRNSWIGANSVVVRGAHIGQDAVIAAGSVVTREISDGAIAAGVPAIPIHFRNPGVAPS